MKKTVMALLAFTSITSQAFVASPITNNKLQKLTHNGELSTVSVDSVSMLKANSPLAAMKLQAIKLNQNGMVRIQQTHQGLDVYGAEAVFEIQNGKVLSTDGRTAMINLNSTTVSFSNKQAMTKAQTLMEGAKFNSALKVYPLAGETHLVWHLVESAFASKWNYFIDAQTGKVVDSFNELAMGTGAGHDRSIINVASTFSDSRNKFTLEVDGEGSRITHDAESQRWGALPGKVAVSEDDHWEDAAQVDAHEFAGNYLKILKEKFNRNSFDDKGAKIISTVHYKKDYVNAFWNGTQMAYGDGDGVRASNLAGGFDVIAHELTHAITTNTSNLIYRNESGALNEAFSDIMATYAESVFQPRKFDWMIGEDIWTPATEGDALRYMNNPKKDGRSYDFYPTRYTGSGDNGGVHLNSGIANLAFYLLSEGGKHPRLGGEAVKGLGIEKAIHLFYNTFTKRLTRSSQFIDARKSMLKEAKALGDAAVQSVKDAWSTVGVE
ncbi:MAG: bacillolysin [Thermoproteota archaeon]|jgi:bacillolysin